MINKFYKRIHNRYLSLFKFIFFIRYLFIIFFISLTLFISIPNFFDNNKHQQIFKNYLFKNYGLKLKNFENIKFNSFPIPNLEIENATLDLNESSIKLQTKKLNIYPKFVNIYNYNNFEANKIVLKNNYLLLNIKDTKVLNSYIYKLKKKFKIKDLKIQINKGKKSLINIEKVNFSNYGYKKNIVEGEVFEKKFTTVFKNNFQNINFKLLETGIIVSIDLTKKLKNSLYGNIKAKVINSNMKFNFELNDKKLIVEKFVFRNKDLLVNGESIVNHNPFLSIHSNITLKDIDSKIFKEINLQKILDKKKIIKKINNKSIINYESKRFRGDFLDDFQLNIDLAYGKLIYSKSLLISDSIINCRGEIDLVEEYPQLKFNCKLNSKDKRKLLKKFSIKYKIKKEPLFLNTEGSLNILNNKISFESIKMNNNYKANKEDLNYFKENFESILFDSGFFNIFNKEKIKEFILQIS